MVIGKRIKLLRKEKNVTQEQMGKDLNIAKSTISQYENNINTPDATMLNNIANYFNVSVDFLLGKTNVRKEEANEIADEFIQILIDEGLVEEGQELTPDQREKYLDLFRQSIKLVKKLK